MRLQSSIANKIKAQVMEFIPEVIMHVFWCVLRSAALTNLFVGSPDCNFKKPWYA